VGDLADQRPRWDVFEPVGILTLGLAELDHLEAGIAQVRSSSSVLFSDRELRALFARLGYGPAGRTSADRRQAIKEK